LDWWPASAVDPCEHHIRITIRRGPPCETRPANDIRSLNDSRRHTVELLDRPGETGDPLVPTVNGKTELVVQDAAAYQALLDRVDTIDKAGRTRPVKQVFDRLRRRHRIPR
jgi:hypothetical protein